MRLRKECEFVNELTFAVLKEHGWKGSVQGARAVPVVIASFIDGIQIEKSGNKEKATIAGKNA